MTWIKQLHWQILIGLAAGALFGLVAVSFGWNTFTADWIAPFGTIFVNLLKFVAVPLVVTSLMTGVASLSDLKKLSRMGGKTIGFYLLTTTISVTLGLFIVNAMKPGKQIPAEMRDQLQATYETETATRQEAATAAGERGPLAPLVEMVPDNFVSALVDNRNMLQVVFAALILGIALARIPRDHSKPVLDLLKGLNEVVIQLVHLIMLMAPLGVFALIAGTITSLGENPQRLLDLLGALGYYCLAVMGGLAIHTLLIYPFFLKLFTGISWKRFFTAMAPAQLVAFSTSSSGATLPVTMEQCEKELGVSEEVSSFVLPLGATINMDGTALYQAVAAVFIAQALAMDLTLVQQISIVLTAVLASIGTAAVPGAGIIMLVIILQAIHVPTSGIALILGVDRILDMLRTVTNVTGDATVATIVAGSEDKLKRQSTGGGT